MPVITYLFLGIFLLIIQTSLLSELPEWLGKPDLLFVLIVFVALRLELFRGAFLLLLFGLIMDIFSGIFLGLYPIIYLLLFFILYALSKRLIINEVVQQIPLVLLCYLFVNGLLYVLVAMLEPDSTLIWNWKKIILQLLLLAVITLPLFALFESIETWFTPRKAGRFLQRSKPRNTFRT